MKNCLNNHKNRYQKITGCYLKKVGKHQFTLRLIAKKIHYVDGKSEHFTEQVPWNSLEFLKSVISTCKKTMKYSKSSIDFSFWTLIYFYPYFYHFTLRDPRVLQYACFSELRNSFSWHFCYNAPLKKLTNLIDQSKVYCLKHFKKSIPIINKKEENETLFFLTVESTL